MSPPTRVSLELGKTWVFACALDWPGWCRRGRGEQAALEVLRGYAGRYAPVAGPGFAPGEFLVVGRVPGTATTDFGAPDATGEWDEEPLGPDEAGRLAGLLDRCWQAFDAAVAEAPAQLRKGPRGGGRDRDAVADHVREAERSYGRKLGVRLPPRTPWPEQRAAFLDAVREGAPEGTWPVRYAVRRFAWHVLDHAWEIEDRGARPHPGGRMPP
jgi:hypothetical protein